jgi:hypothetical protein
MDSRMTSGVMPLDGMDMVERFLGKVD